MKLTLDQIIEAIKAGYQPEIIINGEYYELDTDSITEAKEGAKA